MSGKTAAAAILFAAACGPAFGSGPARTVAGKPPISDARRWAAFYGGELSREAWGSLDLAVVDSDGFRPPAPSSSPVRLAYVSVGEADERRALWPEAAGRDFLVEPDPDWPQAHRADLRSPEWRRLVEFAVSSAVARGYDGVMLDTIDVADYLESSAPARFAGSRDAALGLLKTLRRSHPRSVILVNNGLYLLDRAVDALDGVVVEDLYTRCLPKDDACSSTPESESLEKERTLLEFARSTGKPVFVILYARLKQRNAPWIKAAVARCRRLGFRPYLAGPGLERYGSVDPQER